MAKRKGLQYVATLPGDERAVSMVTFRDTIFLATTKRCYKCVNDVWIPMEFVMQIERKNLFVCSECGGDFKYDGLEIDGQYGGKCGSCGYAVMFGEKPPE